jgi:carboxylesterase type B
MFSLVGWFTLTALLGVAQLLGAQDVETIYGTVRGQTMPVEIGLGIVNVTTFWGIRYAKPPVGDLRFELPQKPEPFDDVFVADTLTDVCMQNPIGLMFMTHPFWTKYSEDCLSLNIAKPANVAAEGTLAVMVYFHGGAYTGGAGIQYPGHFMAARDVIVVTINYRLGVFGFANTADGLIKGNMGLYDQVAALEWVRDNIRAFGGNPNNVIIFGQSAGASSTALHMVSPVSKGLFHKGIMQSGSDTNIWTLNYPEQSPENYIYQVADKAGCSKDDIPTMVACLKALPAALLHRADDIQCTPGYFCQGFAPIVDGPGGFMPERPSKLREELKENSVPIIGGICRDDGSLFTIFFIPEANNGGFTREEFEFYLRTRLVDIFKPAMSDEVYEQSYAVLDWKYTPWPYIDDEEANRQAFNKLITDAGFGYSWDRNAKLNSLYAPTYTYIQSYLSLNSTSFIPEWMGVPHEGELAYVWAYSYLLVNPQVREDSLIFFDIVGWVPEDLPYSDYVQTLWTNFAKYGNPTPTPVPSPYNDTTTIWPRFSWDDHLKTLELDGTIRVLEDYKQQDYAFFTYYTPTITGVPVKNAVKRRVNKNPLRLKSSTFQKYITKMVEDRYAARYPGQYEEKFAELKRLYNMD